VARVDSDRPRPASSQPGPRSAPGGVAPASKIVLIGFVGAGNSTAGRRLARHLDKGFADSDALLEERLGEPVASFFDREGEQAFREREREVVLELLGRPAPEVIALGGGAVESEQVRAALAPHLTAHVHVDPETAWRRSSRTARPLARDRVSFLGLYGRRLPLYEDVAALRLVWADVGSGHPVLIGPGAIEAAGALWPKSRRRAFIVEDALAAEHHGKTLRASLESRVEIVGSIPVPPGERSKSLGEAERVLRALAAAGVQRADAIVVLGGGVTGDLAGFCAATYQRGVQWVQVPTTLVGQVDSAYGGKTGVDLPEGKNYVGAFHQPEAVFTDPELLATLPPAELSSGWAEVVKTALIAGADLWEEVRVLPPVATALSSELQSVARIVHACARAKLAVVAADERDTGVRASLNLGHTFAHALESATGYARYRHGEAVALGLLVALRVSERELGLDSSVREEVRALLEREALPTSFQGPPTAALMEHASRDKKRSAGGRNLVLLRRPGEVVTHAEVDSRVLEEAIDEISAAAAVD
jgi:shikimate kinase / 3-dehydroquinate synthase